MRAQRGPARRGRASRRDCRRPAGRCSCPARRPGCGCARRRQQEAAPVTKAFGSPVMDPIGREPAAFPEREIGPASPFMDGMSSSNSRSSRSRRRFGRIPMTRQRSLPLHRKEQVKAVPPEIDIELAGLHRPRRFGVGDEERLLIGRAGKADAAHFAHRAVRAIAARHPLCVDLARASVRGPECHLDVIGRLFEPDQFSVPRDRNVVPGQFGAENCSFSSCPSIRTNEYGLRSRPISPNGTRAVHQAVRPHVGAAATAPRASASSMTPIFA